MGYQTHPKRIKRWSFGGQHATALTDKKLNKNNQNKAHTHVQLTTRGKTKPK
jgi:hypothetical protein